MRRQSSAAPTSVNESDLTALEEMFQAARGIMNWLTHCAKVIA